jgi:hypothetical protein
MFVHCRYLGVFATFVDPGSRLANGEWLRNISPSFISTSYRHMLFEEQASSWCLLWELLMFRQQLVILRLTLKTAWLLDLNLTRHGLELPI